MKQLNPAIEVTRVTDDKGVIYYTLYDTNTKNSLQLFEEEWAVLNKFQKNASLELIKKWVHTEWGQNVPVKEVEEFHTTLTKLGVLVDITQEQSPILTPVTHNDKETLTNNSTIPVSKDTVTPKNKRKIYLQWLGIVLFLVAIGCLSIGLFETAHKPTSPVAPSDRP